MVIMKMSRIAFISVTFTRWHHWKSGYMVYFCDIHQMTPLKKWLHVTRFISVTFSRWHHWKSGYMVYFCNIHQMTPLKKWLHGLFLWHSPDDTTEEVVTWFISVTFTRWHHWRSGYMVYFCDIHQMTPLKKWLQHNPAISNSRISKFRLYRSSICSPARHNVNQYKRCSVISNSVISKSQSFWSYFSVPVNQKPILT